jgi:hypothetical protein
LEALLIVHDPPYGTERAYKALPPDTCYRNRKECALTAAQSRAQIHAYGHNIVTRRPLKHAQRAATPFKPCVGETRDLLQMHEVLVGHVMKDLRDGELARYRMPPAPLEIFGTRCLQRLHRLRAIGFFKLVQRVYQRARA